MESAVSAGDERVYEYFFCVFFFTVPGERKLDLCKIIIVIIK